MLRYVLIFGIICSLAALTGCGIRPERLEPPAGAEETVYPRTYPDPATDPQP